MLGPANGLRPGRCPLQVQVLQHVPFEGLGNIEGWLARRGASVGWTRMYAGEALPEPATVDLVVTLGGPMSVNAEREHPWLVEEKRFLSGLLDEGRCAVLGICLGAQMIAAASGAAVRAAEHREIGWFEVRAEPAPTGAIPFPDRILAFHWHGETFDLPQGAVHLARSEACAHQAFQLGGRVLALQFHPESTPRSAGSILRHCAHELVPGPFVQSPRELRGAPGVVYDGLERFMAGLLDELVPASEEVSR